jgi:hypothetical protein
VNKHQKADLDQAQRLAGDEAQKIAEDYGVRFIQDLCADLNKAAGKTYHLPPGEFEQAYTYTRGLIFHAAFDRLFQEKLDELTKEAKRIAAAERRELREQAECDAWRREGDADRVEAPDNDDDVEDRLEDLQRRAEEFDLTLAVEAERGTYTIREQDGHRAHIHGPMSLDELEGALDWLEDKNERERSS